MPFVIVSCMRLSLCRTAIRTAIPHQRRLGALLCPARTNDGLVALWRVWTAGALACRFLVALWRVWTAGAPARRFLEAKARAHEQLGTPMYPPGRIAFLRRLKPAHGARGASWDGVWVCNEVRRVCGRDPVRSSCWEPLGALSSRRWFGPGVADRFRTSVCPTQAAEQGKTTEARARACLLRAHQLCVTRRACKVCVRSAPSRTLRPESLPVPQDLIEEGLLISASMLRHHKINTMGRALEAAENVAREQEQD